MLARGVASFLAQHDAVATIGRIESLPGATNAVPSSVRAWLDARAVEEDAVDAVLADVTRAAHEAGTVHGVTVERTQESRSPAVEFPAAVLDWFGAHLGDRVLTVVVERDRLPLLDLAFATHRAPA